MTDATPWKIRSGLLLLACIVLVTMLYRRQAEARRLERLADAAVAVSTSFDTTRREWRDNRGRVHPWVGLSPINNHELDDLRRLGLEHPLADLVADLVGRPDVIPYRSRTGSAFVFLPTEAIRVLNSQWVFARFEDGHTGGELLLAYQVRPGGRVEWKVVASRLD